MSSVPRIEILETSTNVGIPKLHPSPGHLSLEVDGTPKVYPDSRILKKLLILQAASASPELTGKHAQKVTRHLMFSRILRVWYAGLGVLSGVECLCLVIKALGLIPSK